MFVPKVDWGTGGAAATSNSSANRNQVPFGFGGSAVPFGGSGATSNAQRPAFGGVSSGMTGAAQATAMPTGLTLSSQGSSRAAASFGGPSASFGGSSASFGGASEQRGQSAASSLGGLGFSTSSWNATPVGEHNINCTSVREYAY